MRRILTCFCAVLVLTGCASSSGGEMNRALALRGKLLKGESWGFQTEISADFGEKVYDFGMDCQADNKGNVAFTVTAPETISGITGEISAQGGNLTYDGTALAFDLLADGRLSPVSGPWVLVSALRGGSITGVGEQDGRLVLNVNDSYEDDALTLDVTLDENDLPARAEIFCQGKRILSMTLKNVVIS